MKIKVKTNIRVEADLSAAVYRPKNDDDHIKQLERAIADFRSFIRDHRSMDWVSLSVTWDYEDQCSHCGYTWELDDQGAPVCCQKAIDEHESATKGEAA